MLIKFILQVRFIIFPPCRSSLCAFCLLALSFSLCSEIQMRLRQKYKPKKMHFINAFIHSLFLNVVYYYYYYRRQPTVFQTITHHAELIMDVSWIPIMHRSISQNTNLCTRIFSLTPLVCWRTLRSPYKRYMWIHTLNANHVCHPSYADVRPLALSV